MGRFASRKQVGTFLDTFLQIDMHRWWSREWGSGISFTIPGIPNSAVIARVRNQLAISTGSACSSGVETPYKVIVSRKEART